VRPGGTNDPYAEAWRQQQAANQASDYFNQIAQRNMAPQDPANYGYGSGMGGGGMGGMIPPGSTTAPPPGGAGAGNFLGSAVKSFQDAQNAANEANRQMYGNIMQGYGTLGGNLAQTNAGLAGLYGQRTNDFGSAMSNIGQGYGSMLGAALGNLDLLGRTEATDLNEAFSRNQADAQQSLMNRGLTNTTVTDAVNRGINLDKQRALTNLAQNVAGQTNQTLAQFGMPALQFGQQAAGGLADLQGQALQFGNEAQQQQTGLGQNQLNFMQSVNQQGPDYNTLAQLMMAAGAAGTGYGQNGFANMPNFPSQNPVGALPGATLSNPFGQQPTTSTGLSQPPGYTQYMQALQAQRQPIQRQASSQPYNMYAAA